MSTLIQIKRSTSTDRPTSLANGELGYSYSSNVIWIGTSDGSDVQPIGGSYYINHINAAFAAANTGGQGAANAFDQANAAYTQANAAYSQANSVALGANAYTDTVATSVGTGANAYASAVGVAANTYLTTTLDGANTAVGTGANAYSAAVGTSANLYADSVGTSANAYADNTFLPLTGGTISQNLVITGNLTVSGETTYANTQTMLIGDNIFVTNADLPSGTAPSEDSGIEVNRGSATNATIIWDESADKWVFGLVDNYLNIASNTDVEGVAAGANAYAVSVGTSANAYATSVGASSNAYTNAANTFLQSFASNATNITTGTLGTSRLSGNYSGITGVGTIVSGTWNGSTVGVPYGGTGATTFTTNGIIYGNGTGALQVTAAGTEGQVLQAGSGGTPEFNDLDGGTF